MKFKMTQEKELIIGMIVNDEFIKQISTILNVSYLQASSSRTIATWCLDYYANYKQAPKEFIQDIYLQHKKYIAESDAEIIANTLQHVSETYATKDKYNVAYMIDKAILYVRERRLALLQDALEREVVSGNLDKAENLILGYNKLTRSEHRITNMWDNKTLISRIFRRENTDLFKMPGVLGELMGYFRRDNLYSYAGIAKRGKSRWLSQTATLASLQGCNTVLIELEMSEEEIYEITMNNLVRKPPNDCVLTIPYFGEDNAVLHKNVEFKGYTEGDYHTWAKKGGIIGVPLHIVVKNPMEATLASLEEELLKLEYYEGFIPDVIVVDYADYIQGKGYDQRDRVNNIWSGLKSWAKRYHCAVITASHLNGDALKKDGDAYNIGEDKRKLHHVSGMYILNQTENEKKLGMMRIKATATRFSSYTELDEVTVLYNFSAGRTYIDSRWRSDIPDPEE
jgi:hypothetical protein